MTYHKDAAISAEIMAESKMVAAFSELSRPSNVTPYNAGDVWNNSDTYNPSPFVFQFPISWSGSVIYPLKTYVATSNPAFSSQLQLFLYGGYPVSIPLDNLAFASNMRHYDLRTIGYSQIAVFMNILTGVSGGNGGSTIVTTAASSPVRLSQNAKMYGIVVLNSGYTPLSGESMYIKIVASRRWFYLS